MLGVVSKSEVMVIVSSVVTEMAPAPVSVVDIIVAIAVVGKISVVRSKITIVISMVSKIMIPISVVSMMSPFTVATVNTEMISVSVMVSMVSEMAPVSKVAIMIPVVAPVTVVSKSPVTMVGISMMIAMVSPWFVMLVSTNYSDM